jgi:hypothetical protein
MFHVKHFGTIGKAESSENLGEEFNADSSRPEASAYNAIGSANAGAGADAARKPCSKSA